MTTFNTWLENYPNHKYTEATIKRYVRALDKAEEWLGISLSKKIMETHDYQTFLQVQNEIKNAPDYEEVNRNHGHGDLSAALRLYGLYLQDISNNAEHATDWRPVLSEYDPGISKEKWLEILPDLAGPVWGGALAMFYTEKEGATCSALAEKFNMQPMEISGRCTQLAKRVHKETDCPLWNNGDKDKYWSILFFGRDASSEEKGTFIWKLRPELYDALTEFDILRFLPESGSSSKEPPKFTLTPKETVDYIKNYISSRGFTYSDNLIENFYLSLKSKPFTILAGTSGTGKTKLVKLFAEAIGANEANGRYKMVSVRPDWSDGSDLFGHTDLNGKFIEGPVCSAFDVAMNEPDKPVFLCLDEMNLAHPELYFAEFLSKLELRRGMKGTEVPTLPVNVGAGMEAYDLPLGRNVLWTGTMNQD